MQFHAVTTIVMRVFAVYLPYLTGAVALVLVAKGVETKQRACFFAACIVLALVVSNGLIVHTFHMFGFPFPSTYATLLFTLALGVLLFHEAAGWLMLGTAVLQGLGQAYLGFASPLALALGIVTAVAVSAAGYALLLKPSRERATP